MKIMLIIITMLAILFIGYKVQEIIINRVTQSKWINTKSEIILFREMSKSQKIFFTVKMILLVFFTYLSIDSAAFIYQNNLLISSRDLFGNILLLDIYLLINLYLGIPYTRSLKSHKIA
jgi:hypothetical protein